MPSSQHLPVTLPKQGPPSPLLNLATYPSTIRFPLMWTLAQPRMLMPSEWKQKSATWREEQVQKIWEEQQRYCQRWVAAVHAAWTSRMQAPVPAEDTTARRRPRRPVRFETPSVRATLTAYDASSARASLRTADAMPSPLMGPKYFVRSKESWRQLAECVRHHKSPGLSSQHNNNNISSDSPTAIQQSMEKRGRKSPRRHKFEEDKGGNRTGGGEAHQWLWKRAKKCKCE